MPNITKPIELVQLLLMENTSSDEFLDFQKRFQSFIDQSPSFLHSVGKEGFFPSFFFGAFATLSDSDLASFGNVKVKQIYFRFDDHGALKLAVLTEDSKAKSEKIIYIAVSDKENHKPKFDREELANIHFQAFPDRGQDQQSQSRYENRKETIYSVTIGKERKVACDVMEKPKIGPHDSEQVKNFTLIKSKKENLKDLIEGLANTNYGQVMNTMKEVLDYITGVYDQYKNNEKVKKQFEGKESSYHGFLVGFLMNFKYRYHLKLYPELFAGKGYADIILLVRGADKSLNAVPIIIELKAGTDAKSTSQKAMGQVQDYVKGSFSNFVRMITAAKEVICVGLNFEMNNPQHAKYSLYAQNFLNRKGNSVVEKLLNTREGVVTSEIIRKQLEYLYYGIVWSNGGSNNIHYISQFILGQLVLIPDITDKKKSITKYVFIRSQGQDVSKRTLRSNPNVVDKYALDCVTTTVLIVGNEVFVLNITEMSKNNKESLKAALGNSAILNMEVEMMKDNKIIRIGDIEEIKRIGNVKIHEINCHLHGTPSNKNPFNQYCNENEGVKVKMYNSLNEYKGNREILQRNFVPIVKNKEFNAALKKAIESSKYNDYAEVLREVSRILYPFKSLINNEAEFQAVLHGLFSSYSDDNIKVITEFQVGGGEKLDIMMVVQVVGKNRPPIGIELKFAKPGELNSKIKEAEDQLERYQKGEAYKIITDSGKAKLMYAVFDTDEANIDSLIKVGDKFVDVEVKHSSDTMLKQQPAGNIQHSTTQKVGTSQAVNQ